MNIMQNRSGKFVQVVSIAIFMGFVAFIFIVIVPGYKSGVIHANQRICHNNLQIISGKIEMARLDGFSDADLIQEDGQIKMIALTGDTLQCPFSGKYLLATGSQTLVYCSFHGDSEKTIPGNLDPDYSALYWLTLWLKGIFASRH